MANIFTTLRIRIGPSLHVWYPDDYADANTGGFSS